MKKLVPILALAVVPALLIHDAYQFVVTDEGMRYYTSEPRRLLYVVCLALGGGLVALLLSRLSPQLQRGLKLSAIGLLGSAFTIFVGLFAFFGLRVTELLTLKDAALMATGFVAFGGMAAYFWFEFIHLWRTGKTRFM